MDDKHLAADEYVRITIQRHSSGEEEVAVVDPREYLSLQGMLNAFYMGYLQDIQQIFTYGSAWILATNNYGIQRLAVPWSWLQPTLRHDPLHDILPDWAMDTPSAFGFLPGTSWRIVSTSSYEATNAVGLVTNSAHFARHVASLAHPKTRPGVQADRALLGFLRNFAPAVAVEHGGKYHDDVSSVLIGLSELVDSDDYPYHFILGSVTPGLNARAIIYNTSLVSSDPPWF
jgi:hypothetical protein